MLSVSFTISGCVQWCPRWPNCRCCRRTPISSITTAKKTIQVMRVLFSSLQLNFNVVWVVFRLIWVLFQLILSVFSIDFECFFNWFSIDFESIFAQINFFLFLITINRIESAHGRSGQRVHNDYTRHPDTPQSMFFCLFSLRKTTFSKWKFPTK